MSHYEERLEQDQQEIRSRVRSVSETVEEALKESIQTVLSGDEASAGKVILGDLPINREIRSIDGLCHAFVAQHLPSAGHLRFVSSVLRLNVELERVGDYAVAIARETVQLSARPTGSVARDIELIGDQARRLLHQALQAYNEGNAELARGTKMLAKQVDTTFQKVFADLLQEGEKGAWPLRDIFAFLVIFNRLGRVSDHAKNICEDTLFAVAGETKGAKMYRILFVDRGNDALSQLAKAFANKAFSEHGVFSSAGWQPADSVRPAVEVFMDQQKLDGQNLQTRTLGKSVDELAEYHVIVGLEGNLREHIPEVPFHTVLLNWDVGEIPQELDQERSIALLEESLKKLSVESRELMETMRGKEVS